MTPLDLSIVIPTHNRSQLLKEMLASIPSQTYPMDRFEIVVVVDGSKDGTMEMLRDLRTPYRLRALWQEQSGPSAARNHGAREAQGDILVFLDDDLLPKPQLLEEHVRVHCSDPKAVVLGRLLPDPAGKKGGWNIWEEETFEKHYQAMQDGKRPPAGRRLYSGNFSLRRELFWAVGGFDERLKRGEDVELGIRLERAGAGFHFDPEAAVLHRGYRSFDSWCQSAYLYGRTDVQMARRRDHQHRLAELLRWYLRQPSPVQWAMDLYMRRGRTRNAMREILKTASGAMTRLGAHRVAHYGYSSIYKLQYWYGAADQLGGPKAFHDFLRHTREGGSSTQAVGSRERTDAGWTG